MLPSDRCTVPRVPLAPGTELGTEPAAVATGHTAVQAAEAHCRCFVVSPAGLYSARPDESTSTVPCPVLRALTGADEPAEGVEEVPLGEDPVPQPAAISGAAAAGASHQSRRDRCWDNESQDIVLPPVGLGYSLSDTAGGRGSFRG
ncbi:hypothetical protein Athai_29530 [Actinocatenispora thailandica]|uniref:Uncharacterized protein n=1 Tax=Actinocatenispora thailandica TaxID=227318 RepID=A0A7R7DPV7_9ACTN|nr:hypothetical protein Athai_29530 [Actinocatenispora thailandica]